MTQIADTGKPITGRKFALIICSGFAVVIGVNLTLAYQAIATFPGLEVANSYVASQNFDADRAAQTALGWDVRSEVDGDILRLSFSKDGNPVAPQIVSAVLGRATNVAEDQMPDFVFDGIVFTAPVDLAGGNWNLRVVAQAGDGTIFRQRVIVRIAR